MLSAGTTCPGIPSVNVFQSIRYRPPEIAFKQLFTFFHGCLPRLGDRGIPHSICILLEFPTVLKHKRQAMKCNHKGSLLLIDTPIANAKE